MQRTLKWVLSQEEAEERNREAAAGNGRHHGCPPAREGVGSLTAGSSGSRPASSGGSSRHSSGGKLQNLIKCVHDYILYFVRTNSSCAIDYVFQCSGLGGEFSTECHV